MSQVIIVMGVAGAGKTTVGRRLAAALGCPFLDGDDFHPPRNVAKMAAGIPLTDADRAPWLARLASMIQELVDRGGTAVLAISALKKRYRDQLRVNEDVHFVYLEGTFEVIWERMGARQDHYMKADMLRSQFAALEPPGEAEAIRVSVEQPAEAIVGRVLAALQPKE